MPFDKSSPKTDPRLTSDHNVFGTTFGTLSDNEWVDILVRSLGENVISGVSFPTFPAPEVQNGIHGHSGEHSLREAGRYYQLVKKLAYPQIDLTDAYFLDYGAGWGRISRLFMRDFPLKHMFAYEPNLSFAVVGRACNPYLNYVTGGYRPDGVLPAGKFSLAVGWSVFSHLSEAATAAWLEEMGRIMKPGGICVFTTWGRRWLNHLRTVEQKMAAGEEVHWFQKLSVERAGSLDELSRQYEAGEFVWFGANMGPDYGETFISERSLQTLIANHNLPFEITAFDTETTPQDAFAIRRL